MKIHQNTLIFPSTFSPENLAVTPILLERELNNPAHLRIRSHALIYSNFSNQQIHLFAQSFFNRTTVLLSHPPSYRIGEGYDFALPKSLLSGSCEGLISSSIANCILTLAKEAKCDGVYQKANNISFPNSYKQHFWHPKKVCPYTTQPTTN